MTQRWTTCFYIQLKESQGCCVKAFFRPLNIHIMLCFSILLLIFCGVWLWVASITSTTWMCKYVYEACPNISSAPPECRAADVTVVKAMCRNLPGWQRNTSGGQVSDVDVGEMQTWNTECHIVPGQCCTLSALRAQLVLSLILWNTLRCLRLSFRNKKKKSRLIGLQIQKKQVASKQQQKTLSRNFSASYKCKCEQ